MATDPREVVVSQPSLPALAAAGDDDERDRVLGDGDGQVAVGDLRAVALMSNGASRIVDRFGLTDWAGDGRVRRERPH